MPSRPRKPVSYTEERIDTGTPPWEGKTKSKLAKGRSGLSDYSDDEDVENRRPAHNQPTSRQHNNGVKQHSNKPAGGGNGRNRKKVEDEEESEPDEPPRSKHQPEPRSNGDQGGKRIRSPNDSEGRTAAAKKTKQAEQQPLMSNNGRAHGQRKSLEELAAEQQQAEAAKAPKSKPRSKQAKKADNDEPRSQDGAGQTKDEPAPPARLPASHGKEAPRAAQPAPAPKAAQPQTHAKTTQAPAQAKAAAQPQPQPKAAQANAAARVEGPGHDGGMAVVGVAEGNDELLSPGGVVAPGAGTGGANDAFLQLQRKYNRLMELYQQLKAEKIAQLEGLMEEQDTYMQERQDALDEQAARWRAQVEEATQRAQAADTLQEQLTVEKTEVLRLKQQCITHEEGARRLQAEVASLREQLSDALSRLATAQQTNPQANTHNTTAADATTTNAPLPAPATLEPNTVTVGGPVTAGVAAAAAVLPVVRADSTMNLEPFMAVPSSAAAVGVGSEVYMGTGSGGGGATVSTGADSVGVGVGPGAGAASVQAPRRTVSMQCPTPAAQAAAVVASPGVACQYPTPGIARAAAAAANNSPHSTTQGTTGHRVKSSAAVPVAAAAAAATPAPPGRARAAAGAAAAAPSPARTGAGTPPSLPPTAPLLEGLPAVPISVSCLATMDSPNVPNPQGSGLTELVAAGVVLDPTETIQVTEAGSCTGALRAAATVAAHAAAGLNTPHVGSTLVGGMPANVRGGVVGVAGGSDGEQGSASLNQGGVGGDANKGLLEDSPVEGLKQTNNNTTTNNKAVAVAAQPQQQQPADANKRKSLAVGGGKAAASPPPHIRSRPPAPPEDDVGELLPATQPLTQPAAQPAAAAAAVTPVAGLGVVLGPGVINTASTPSLVLGMPPTSAAKQPATAAATPVTLAGGLMLPVRQGDWAGRLDAAKTPAAAQLAAAAWQQANAPAAAAAAAAMHPNASDSASVLGPAPPAAVLQLPGAGVIEPNGSDANNDNNANMISRAAAHGQPLHSSPQFSFQGSTGIVALSGQGLSDGQHAAAAANAAAAAAAVTAAQAQPGRTPSPPPGQAAGTAVAAAGGPSMGAGAVPAGLHEMVAMIRAATPAKTNTGGVGVGVGAAPSQTERREQAPLSPAPAAPATLAAPPSSAAAAGGVRGVWQDIFRWEVEVGGEGGTQGSQYDFHHLDTNMRFRLKRIMVDPTLGTPTNPTDPSGAPVPVPAHPVRHDALIVRDAGLAELAGAGAVMWEYVPVSLGSAGDVLPEWLQEELELPEHEAPRLMLKITSYLSTVVRV